MKRSPVLLALLCLVSLVAADAGTPAPASPAPCPSVSRIKIAVQGQNDEWTSTQLRLEKGDLLFVAAGGAVKVGDWIGEVGPKGAGGGEGRLLAKIGSAAAAPTGERLVALIDGAGVLKLKVEDSKYTDNSGAFTVEVIRVPAALVPTEATVVTATDD